MGDMVEQYKNIISRMYYVANGEVLNDNELERLLKEHKCFYLLSKTNPRMASIDVAINRACGSLLYEECDEIFEQLNSIPYVIMKGCVLSKSIYGDEGYRSIGDIDILVSPKHIEYVDEVLSRGGFVQGTIIEGDVQEYNRSEKIFHRAFTHQLASYIKKTNRRLLPVINIDINIDLLWGESDLNINIDEYLQHTQTVSVFNKSVNKLEPIYEFIALCLHHYKDLNSVYLIYKHGLKLSLFSDIYYYVKNAKLDSKEMYKVAQELGVSKFIYYCLFYTNVIFDDEIISKFLDECIESRDEFMLNSYGLSDNEKTTWNLSFESRLFGKNFFDAFVDGLTSSVKEKIQLNEKYLLRKKESI